MFTLGSQGALKMVPQICFIGTHTHFSNNASLEKTIQVLTPKKFVKGSHRPLTFQRARELKKLFPSTTKESAPIGGWRKLPTPTPIGPLHSFRANLELTNLRPGLQSWESNLALCPFQCMQRMLHYSTQGLPLTWSDLASTLKILKRIKIPEE